MIRKLSVLSILLLSLSCAYAAKGGGAIGTVSVRGDVRVDGYQVWGNGTLFDGTAVGTSQATATLRLNNGTELMLSPNSRAVVYGDHMELMEGASQVKASGSPYRVDARGLRVAPGGSGAVGIVSLSSTQNTIDVAALNGGFRVANGNGIALASVSQATAISLHAAQTSGSPSATVTPQKFEITAVGVVIPHNGHYDLEMSDDSKYELVGKDFKSYVDDKVVVTGTILQPAPTASGELQLTVTSVNINGAAAAGVLGALGSHALAASAVAAGAAGVGFVVYETTKGPASP